MNTIISKLRQRLSPKYDNVHEIVEKHLDKWIYGGPDHEIPDVDFATGLFRQAEDIDALVLLGMMHSRRSNPSILMFLMSRAAELYLKSALARHWLNEGLSIVEVKRKLKDSSNGIGLAKGKIIKGSHSLAGLWQTCDQTLGVKYNLGNNTEWGFTKFFCFGEMYDWHESREDWYQLIYEPSHKIAWSKTKGVLTNNETYHIRFFAEDFLKRIAPCSQNLPTE